MKTSTIKFIVLITLMITGCTFDLKTKELAKTGLREHSIPLVDHYFDLNYVENHAIAFGFLGNIPKNIRIPLIFVLTISATLYGIFIIWKIRHKRLRLLLPFFIMLAGAYGNILDRFINGYVTDFFHLHYYYKYNFPVFNVADVLVNIGVILMILQWKDFKIIFDDLFSKEAKLKTE